MIGGVDVVVIGLWAVSVMPLWMVVLAGAPEPGAPSLDVTGWRVIFTLAAMVTVAMTALAVLAGGA